MLFGARQGRTLCNCKDLRNEAAAQQKTLPKACPEWLRKAIKKMPVKTSGPDGWTASFLKTLTVPEVAELVACFHNWEQEGVLQGQLCVSLTTMLAKNERVERPIALRHYAYRVWAKSRWPCYQEWAASFALTAPWDKAKAGVSSLDVALAHGVSILVDLETFYESIEHATLVKLALEHNFPAPILNLALQVYQGSRYIPAEGSLAPQSKPRLGCWLDALMHQA